ncbi:similar to ankyrin 2,3/unc44 [Ectocarpus siliculosus]|uniref:Similar to ankyrin 2,3/unc44 n=1 Tax=Ectocarpus siliculosus TaxID=2880 RepID=D7G159_ECTSI|nr:similar to ankyrin 2,3/unc44 [Ectocarpus siliculosus]|eukprot:CBJ33169.1 similar to ankyrin 2,3/unc44 [Ectocarpus siliculosus]
MPTLREFDAACTMVEAISCAHTGLAARMLEAGVDPNIPSDGRGGKAPVYLLGLSCFLGRPEMVRLLLQHGASVDKRMRGGETPLQTAIGEGERGIVAQLLAAGADVNLKTGGSGRTALHKAACQGDVQIIKKVIEGGARLDALDAEEYMPIHLAADEGNLPALKELVRAGSDPEWRSGALQPPLANACMSGRTKVAKYLLETCNVDAGTADSVGYTPLAISAQGGHVSIVRMLLKRGVALLGKNAYRDAITGVAMTGNMEMLRELVYVEGGVHLLGAKTSQLMTALHFSAGYCHARATALLLHAGADEGAVDRNGGTPLDVVDTKRSPQGPAYRALSWRWPASSAFETTPDSAAATGGAALALPGLDAAEPGSAKDAAQLVPYPETEKEWVDSDESFDEAFASAVAGSWRLNVAVFRRSRPPPPPCGSEGGYPAVEQRAALVSRFESVL